MPARTALLALAAAACAAAAAGLLVLLIYPDLLFLAMGAVYVVSDLVSRRTWRGIGLFALALIVAGAVLHRAGNRNGDDQR